MPTPESKVTTNCKIACSRTSCGARIWSGNAAAALALAAWYPMVLLAVFWTGRKKTHSKEPRRPEPSQRPPVARDKTPAFREARALPRRASRRDSGKV
jgi:hypothetical protein